MAYPDATVLGYTIQPHAGTVTIPLNATTWSIDPTVNVNGTAPSVGDFIFVDWSAAAGSGLRTPDLGSGWTQIVAFGTNGMGTAAWGLWVRQRQAGDGAYTGTVTNGSNGNATYARMWWMSSTNADAIGNWTFGTLGTRAGSGGTVNTSANKDVVSAPSIEIGIYVDRTTAAETQAQMSWSPNTWTLRHFDSTTATPMMSLTILSQNEPSVGPGDVLTVTYPNSHATNSLGIIIEIPALPVTGLSGEVVNNAGVSQPASWYVMSSDGTIKAPTSLRIIPHGYRGLADMFRHKPFYIAHRGGSKDFPEMSLYGYTRSAYAGYQALEISLARSSDGVWFGLHDAYLDRTSLESSGGTTLQASSMTWAQISAYDISPWQTTNTGQPHRPYAKLTDILNVYYRSHILFIDPKSANSFRSELLDILDALPGNPKDRIVAKFAGNGTSTWATDARARGYKAWGYFYSGDNWATYGSQFDYLGMDYTAPQTDWDSIKALGKPVIGHIVPDAASASTALTKGANGLMVSAPTLVSTGV